MDGERRGDWTPTFSGRVFWPLDPREGEVAVVDIAHALGATCRFGGMCPRYYSVAQHSVLVAQCVLGATDDPRMALIGLFHDAAEAYLGDAVRPLKRQPQFHAYRAAEDYLQAVIYAAVGLGEPDHVDRCEVGYWDERVLVAEVAQLFPGYAERFERRWQVSVAPAAVVIEPLGPADAALGFMEFYAALSGGEPLRIEVGVSGAREAAAEMQRLAGVLAKVPGG